MKTTALTDAASPSDDLATEWLFRSVDDLEVSVRTSYFLQSVGVRYIGDIVRMTEAELLASPKGDAKALAELRAIFSDIGLSFGMSLPDWAAQLASRGLT